MGGLGLLNIPEETERSDRFGGLTTFEDAEPA